MSPITLYSVDPATGASTATLVRGAAGFVVGFAMSPERGQLLISVGDKAGRSFRFFWVDPASGEATAAGSVDRGASEATSDAFYAPYITATAMGGDAVLRLGFKQVTQAEGPALCTTAIGGRLGSARCAALPSVAGVLVA